MNAVVRKVLRVQPDEAVEVKESVDFSAGLTAEERKEADEIADVVVASALRGALNRIDPARYPVGSDPDRLDVRIAATMARLPAKATERIAPRVLKVADGSRKLKRVDPGVLHDSGAVEKLLDSRRLIVPRPKIETDIEVRQGGSAKYNRAILELRAIHCIQETSGGGADEIVFGGVCIGASGNCSPMEAFDAKDFDSGTYAEFGQLQIGRYSLNTVKGYPFHLYATFLLVESDSDAGDTAREMNNTLSSIASMGGLYAGPAAGAAAVVSNVIDRLIDAFFGDDAFRPYGIRLSFNDGDPFDGKSTGPRQRTGDITGDGAKYRIGYRWVLSA